MVVGTVHKSAPLGSDPSRLCNDLVCRMNYDIPCALTTATCNKNENLEDCRKKMEKHMVKAPRGLSTDYVCKHLDALTARRQEDQTTKKK